MLISLLPEDTYPTNPMLCYQSLVT